MCNTTKHPINMSNTSTESVPKYNVNDIVMVNYGGVRCKRHIYAAPYKLNKDDTDWIYPVDYGLSYSSEGIVAEKRIVGKVKCNSV